MEFQLDNILVIDEQAAAMRPAAFESSHKYVVVVSPRHAELREFEAIGWHNNKYRIHTERFPMLSEGTVDLAKFYEVFSRQFAKDTLDVRKAVRMASKVTT